MAVLGHGLVKVLHYHRMRAEYMSSMLQIAREQPQLNFFFEESQINRTRPLAGEMASGAEPASGASTPRKRISSVDPEALVENEKDDEEEEDVIEVAVRPIRARDLPAHQVVHLDSDINDREKARKKCCGYFCGSIDRYRIIDFGCCSCYGLKRRPLVIRIPVKNIDVLVSPELSPFGFRRMDQELSNFLLDKCITNLARNQQVHLHFFLCQGEPEDLERIDEAKLAIANTFRFEGRKANHMLVKALYDGLKTLFMGILVFGCCVGILIGIYDSLPPASNYTKLLADIFIIIIWVALWVPTELLVYGRYQLRRHCRTCVALARSEVTISLLSERSQDATLDEFFADNVHNSEFFAHNVRDSDAIADEERKLELV